MADWTELYALRQQLQADEKKRRARERRATFLSRMRQVYGPGPEDKRCRDCVHLRVHSYGKSYPKCAYAGDTRSVATDWRMTNQTCGKFEAKA